MRLEKAFTISVVSLLVIGLSLAIASAATMRDQVTVNLPYRVMVGDKTLEPGEYTIQDVADTRVQITPKAGASFETDVSRRITTFDDPAPETKVSLDHIGNDYYLNKIYIKGHGEYYEFALPDSAKGRDRERKDPAVLTAQYRQIPDNSPAPTAVASHKAK